jgi:hypothetical protein
MRGHPGPGQPLERLAVQLVGREPAGQFGRAEAPVELEQGERIAAGLLDDPGAHALVERTRRDRREQRAGGLVRQSLQLQPGQAGQVVQRAGVTGRRPGREYQRDRFGQQAAPDEPEDLCGGLVEPLRVVHHAQQRPSLGGLRHQAERREGDQEPVRVVPRGQPERDAQPAPLGFGQGAEPAEHRRAQLVQAGEGKLHLRLDPDGPGQHEVRVRGLAGQVGQQRRLADPGFTPDHQDGALAVANSCDELPQRLLLTEPAEQRRRGPLDRHLPRHPVFSAAERSQLTLTGAFSPPQPGKPAFPAG